MIHFYTQTYSEMGCPGGWELIGSYIAEIKNPTDSGGYGLGVDETFCKAELDFLEKWGEAVVLVNMNFEIREGDGHPCYHNIILRLWGDVYRINSTEWQPRKQKLPCGFKELNAVSKNSK